MFNLILTDIKFILLSEYPKNKTIPNNFEDVLYNIFGKHLQLDIFCKIRYYLISKWEIYFTFLASTAVRAQQ